MSQLFLYIDGCIIITKDSNLQDRFQENFVVANEGDLASYIGATIVVSFEFVNTLVIVVSIKK